MFISKCTCLVSCRQSLNVLFVNFFKELLMINLLGVHLDDEEELINQAYSKAFLLQNLYVSIATVSCFSFRKLQKFKKYRFLFPTK